MRAWFFRKLLGILEWYTPDLIRVAEIQILRHITARGFQAHPRMWAKSLLRRFCRTGQIRREDCRSESPVFLSSRRALAEYAAFTTRCMNSFMNRGEAGSQPDCQGSPTEEPQIRCIYREATTEEQQIQRLCQELPPEKQRIRHLYREAYRAGRRIRLITGFTDSKDISRLIFYLYKNISIAMSGEIPGDIEVRGCYFSSLYTPKQCAIMSFVDAGIIAGIAGGGRLHFTERITEGCGKCHACFRNSH